MSDARERMLAAIRHGLGRGPLSDAMKAGIDARLQGQGVDSLRPQLPDGDPAAVFRKGLERLSGTMTELDSPEAIPAAVTAYLEQENVSGPVAIAPALQQLDWTRELAAVSAVTVNTQQSLDFEAPTETLRFGRAAGDEAVGVSQAFCGIIETGSLVLLSGPDNPTTLNFLPEHHLVVLKRADLVMHIEDVWLRMYASEQDWPRTVNIITGPSRTADIEQTIQLGAHGPRRLHVLLIG